MTSHSYSALFRKRPGDTRTDPSEKMDLSQLLPKEARYNLGFVSSVRLSVSSDRKLEVEVDDETCATLIVCSFVSRGYQQKSKVSNST